MLSVAQVTKELIQNSPFIEEALYEDLINVSSLARKIKPEIEAKLKKEISKASIVMAINRMTFDDRYKMIRSLKMYLKNIGDITVRSSINVFTYLNNPSLSRLQTKLMDHAEGFPESFCTFSQGISERTIIVNDYLLEGVKNIFNNQTLISKRDNLSALSIRLPIGNTEYAGIYYFILKQLAWKNISVVEVISTTNEFTLVVENKDLQNSFTILMNLKDQ